MKDDLSKEEEDEKSHQPQKQQLKSMDDDQSIFIHFFSLEFFFVDSRQLLSVHATCD